MVIRFLIANAYSIGGTIRTTFMTAGELARNHEVEVVSVYRFANEPGLELDPRVRLRTLTDLRPGSSGRPRRWAANRPSRLIHRDDSRYHRFNVLTDVALMRYLRGVRGGVLIGTRPGLNLAIARHAHRSVIRIGQDHMNAEGYRTGLLEAIAAHYPSLDAVTALTEGTADRYRELMGPGGRVACIPNAAPANTGGRRAQPDSRVIMAAGGLNRRKGFDRLLRAWALLAPDHPAWSVEIFGGGPHHDALDAIVHRLGLRRSVRLRGHSPKLMDELSRASLFAMTSRREGFPMVLLEAMSVGLPVVAYDCPTGPRDIVSDGIDGYVVPDGRTRLMAEALGRLMDDDDARRRFGDGALEKAKRYELAAIVGRWEELFGELVAARRGSPTARRRAAATARVRG
jgi:glycosyltransferase involved in cell wall biosynthesis